MYNFCFLFTLRAIFLIGCISAGFLSELGFFSSALGLQCFVQMHDRDWWDVVCQIFEHVHLVGGDVVKWNRFVRTAVQALYHSNFNIDDILNFWKAISYLFDGPIDVVPVPPVFRPLVWTDMHFNVKGEEAVAALRISRVTWFHAHGVQTQSLNRSRQFSEQILNTN